MIQALKQVAPLVAARKEARPFIVCENEAAWVQAVSGQQLAGVGRALLSCEQKRLKWISNILGKWHPLVLQVSFEMLVDVQEHPKFLSWMCTGTQMFSKHFCSWAVLQVFFLFALMCKLKATSAASCTKENITEHFCKSHCTTVNAYFSSNMMTLDCIWLTCQEQAAVRVSCVWDTITVNWIIRGKDPLSSVPLFICFGFC